MDSVIFSSWSGKIVDNREGKTTQTGMPEDITIPKLHDGEAKGALIGWNGLIVMSPAADILSLTLNYLKEARRLSCGECSVCMIGIDMLLDIMNQMGQGKGSYDSLEEMEKIINGVSENSKCGFGQSALFPVLDSIKHFRSDFIAFMKGERKLEDRKYFCAVTAPCIEACPARLDIPGYIELIRNNKIKESLRLIRENCILPGVVGRVCTHPCEEACVRKDMDESLAIRLLKRAAADFDLQQGASSIDGPRREKKKKIAIIGAGPAGLAAAYNLRVMGYGVTIFESLPYPGGMAVVGIPEYRLPRNILNHEIDLIKRIGVEIRTNMKVEKLTLKDLREKGYDAVFVAVGAHEGNKIGAEGEDKEYEGFVQGVQFLRDFNLGKKIASQNKVVIVGGGNVAMDCSRTCVRLGFKQVEIIYRRSREEMPASDEEIEGAQEEGVHITFLATPVKVLAQNGKIKGLECIRMKLGEPDESGRRKPVPGQGSEFTISADVVIPAIGQSPELLLISEEEGIRITDWGTIDVDPETYMTGAEGVFAGGDCVAGPGILIDALNMGNRVARSIDCYLEGGSLKDGVSFEKVDLKDDRGRSFIVKKPSEKVKILDVMKRSENFEEIEGAFSSAEAMREAQRCLRCYRIVVWQGA